MPDFEFLRETDMSDHDWLRKVLCDTQKLSVSLIWDFDEQQADPFHHNFTSDEFVRRLRRFISETD